MNPSSVLNGILRENEGGDYTSAFALLSCVEGQLRDQAGSEADLLAKRAYLQAAIGDPLGAYDSCTQALELQWNADLLCLRARCSLNTALCLSGVLAFPAGHRSAPKEITIRLALQGALRDLVAAGILCNLDEETVALFNGLVWILDRCHSERALRHELRSCCLEPRS